MNERLKEVRCYYELSTRDLASMLGMSAGAISLLETGKRNITSQFIKLLLSAFPDVSEEWFRNGTGEMLRPKDRNSEIADIVAEMFKSEDSDFRFQLTKMLYEMEPSEIAALKNIALKIAAAIKEDLPG